MELFCQAYNPSPPTTVETKDINVSTIIQHGHAIPMNMEYHYAAIDKTEFS